MAQPILPPKQVKYPPPLSPIQSLSTFKVPAGLKVELVASEPAVSDPIDIAWGSDGRMWVVEMADYPSGIDGKGKPGGRVRVLESTQRDGRYDKSTLFADGLKFPTSAVPWRDGVLVTAAPDILFLQDTDGDGRADRTTKLFTNLGEGNPQHMANGLQWGLDGWLHLANGGTRGDIASAKTGRSVEMGRDVRIKPDEGLAEPQLQPLALLRVTGAANLLRGGDADRDIVETGALGLPTATEIDHVAVTPRLQLWLRALPGGRAPAVPLPAR
jgi:glucose/arabinose dehydrogenase